MVAPKPMRRKKYCKVAEQPNHLSADATFSEVAGFKNPLAARHADASLRSKHHKFTVHTQSPITYSFSSDDEQIGSLDGIILLPSSNNGLKPVKWNTMKTNKVSTMRKFAMRRAARKHKVLDSSHGAKRRPTASISRYSKAKEASVFQSTPILSSTGVPYKTKIIKVPLKLTILPTEETVVPSADTADTESERVSKEDDTTGDGEGKSSKSLPHGEPRLTGHEGSTTRHGRHIDHSTP
ncbi:hypothetical protein OS493_009655 [Desmophyllum pertusum]|uniref:Uncharacterized protein n=1 Tax=Desmophyllum pertusum TaxID=174260 RepID=A0A9W9YR50_9CNID|nr:hypothetical protein OS493_009655 [Desmophyllum pertusum]